MIVHDPQPAGLIAPLRAAGAAAIWRCHVGLDRPNNLAHDAWDFLRPYAADADAYVFSRESFAWKGLDRDRIAMIPPSIDVFSPKNQDLERTTVLCSARAGCCWRTTMRDRPPSSAETARRAVWTGRSSCSEAVR